MAAIEADDVNGESSLLMTPSRNPTVPDTSPTPTNFSESLDNMDKIGGVGSKDEVEGVVGVFEMTDELKGIAGEEVEDENEDVEDAPPSGDGKSIIVGDFVDNEVGSWI